MNQDTIRLLEECNSGIKMAVTSIDEVLPAVQSDSLREHLETSRHLHEELGEETARLLSRSGKDGKEPNPMAKGMSWLKTNVMLTMKREDTTVADLMMDGCNMGIKSLARYLNRFETADAQSRDLTRRLIGTEDRMAGGLRPYL